MVYLNGDLGTDIITIRSGVMSEEARQAIEQAQTNVDQFEQVNGNQTALADAHLAALNLEQARLSLETDVQQAQDALDAHGGGEGEDALIQTLNEATATLNQHITNFGSTEALSTAVTQASSLLMNHTVLSNQLQSAIDIGKASYSNSDSYVLNAEDHSMLEVDTIYGFDLSSDKLNLASSSVAADVGNIIVNGVEFSISNGIATLVGGYDYYSDALAALATHLGDSTDAVAFRSPITTKTYVLQGEGVEGLQASDVVVELTGVIVEDLSAILAA